MTTWQLMEKAERIYNAENEGKSGSLRGAFYDGYLNGYAEAAKELKELREQLEDAISKINKLLIQG